MQEFLPKNALPKKSSQKVLPKTYSKKLLPKKFLPKKSSQKILQKIPLKKSKNFLHRT
jgi:hypothetical protein